MAREPDARYADMRELAADLRAFLELRVVGAYGGGTWIELSKWVRRNRAVTGAGFVAVLALVAGLAVSVIHGRRADAAATVADANFQLASEAVTELIRIGSIELENVPQLDAVRRQMLRRAVAFQELFVDARSNDLKVRERAAIASIRLGYLQRQLGSLDEARASLLAGIARLEALVRELPHRHDLGASLLWGHNDLASVLMDRGDVEGSLARLDVALKVADDLTRQQPTVPEYRRRRAGTLHNRAIACIKLGRHEEALALAREEIGIRKSLAAEFPDDALDSGHLAQAHTQCASSLIPLQRAGEALAELEEAVRLHTEVLARMPQDRDCRARAAHSWGELGILHKARGAFPKAQHATEQAIALRRALAQDFPQTPSYHSSLGAGLNNLAMLHVDIGDDAKARVAILEAIGAQSRALRASPDQPQFQTYLANHYGVLFWVLGRQGDHRELASRADEFRGLALPRKAQTLHGLGQQFLHCAALLREDQVLAEAERDRLAEEYTRRGIETLSEAFDEGWREWNLSELAHPALRGREDFRKLFARVKAAEAVPREPERRR
jgi:tetratricopeptide (TPR) repeat protein